MTSLGLMASTILQEELYFTGIAEAAKEMDMTVYRFCPSGIDSSAKVIHGECYRPEDNSWTEATFPIPDFIYDRCFHGLRRQANLARKAIGWLKNSTSAHFLGYGLPGKWEVYNALLNIPELVNHLPATTKVHTPEDVHQQIDHYSRIMLKPEYGSRGNGIYMLSRLSSGFLIKMEKNHSIYERHLTIEETNNWLEQLLQNYPYLSQPFLELSTSQNRPFDVRILMQKDDQCSWVERGRGIRLGMKDRITANLAKGAEAVDYHTFIQNQPFHNSADIQSIIKSINEKIPLELEKRFHRLFELGIDLGIDKKGHVWILDINSKPGRKIIHYLDSDKLQQLYQAPSLYCSTIQQEHSKAGD